MRPPRAGFSGVCPLFFLDKLVSSGFNLDLVDRWEGTQPEDIRTLNVAIHEISLETFRMFENHKFRLVNEQARPTYCPIPGTAPGE
jgi:hypothetical protein